MGAQFLENTEFSRAVASRIQEAREQAGISYRRLEEASGVKKDRICRVLTGKRVMTVAELGLLCDGLGLNVSDVVKKD